VGSGAGASCCLYNEADGAAGRTTMTAPMRGALEHLPCAMDV
jgi:hypothetical protein